MNKLILIVSLLFATNTFAQKNQKERIIYKYKKYQKFDFEDLTIEGETGSPPDLGVDTRLQRKFRNKLPYRKNFNPEIRKGIERIR
ncbi:MAG: hypothetical protein CME70_21840 [Halobacteriovorax sp.]|nr:hypothetical protein [Halobacteriovorax sp.]|tara:strand:- start:38507 stop:38764 length:258 start_codon:yes stop_codon:yes gene_type:complete